MRAMWVYLVRCRNGALYCGQTANLHARMRAHSTGRGARFMRMAGYAGLACCWRVVSRGDALRLEAAIRTLAKVQKEALVSTPQGIVDLAEPLGIAACAEPVTHLDKRA